MEIIDFEVVPSGIDFYDKSKKLVADIDIGNKSLLKRLYNELEKNKKFFL